MIRPQLPHTCAKGCAIPALSSLRSKQSGCIDCAVLHHTTSSAPILTTFCHGACDIFTLTVIRFRHSRDRKEHCIHLHFRNQGTQSPALGTIPLLHTCAIMRALSVLMALLHTCAPSALMAISHSQGIHQHWIPSTPIPTKTQVKLHLCFCTCFICTDGNLFQTFSRHSPKLDTIHPQSFKPVLSRVLRLH